jgi:hypothetical protein
MDFFGKLRIDLLFLQIKEINTEMHVEFLEIFD